MIKKGALLISLCGVLLCGFCALLPRESKSFADKVSEIKDAGGGTSTDLPVLLTVASALDFFCPRSRLYELLPFEEPSVYLHFEEQEFPESLRNFAEKVGMKLHPFSQLSVNRRRSGNANWIHISEVQTLGPTALRLHWIWKLETLQGVGGLTEVSFEESQWIVTKFAITSIS